MSDTASAGLPGTLAGGIERLTAAALCALLGERVLKPYFPIKRDANEREAFALMQEAARRIKLLDSDRLELARLRGIESQLRALESFGAEVELRTPTGSGDIVTRSEVEVFSAAEVRHILGEEGS
jgi:hypothetical protein